MGRAIFIVRDFIWEIQTADDSTEIWETADDSTEIWEIQTIRDFILFNEFRNSLIARHTRRPGPPTSERVFDKAYRAETS